MVGGTIAISAFLTIPLLPLFGIPLEIYDGNWVGYWGSVFGAAITSAITLLMLYFTIKSTQYQVRVESYRKDLEFLRQDISRRVGEIDFTEVAQYVIKYRDLKVNEIWLELNDLFSKYMSAMHSAQVLYETSIDKSKQKDAFISVYKDCLQQICDKIKKVQEALTTNTDIKELIRLSKMEGDEEKLKVLFTAATNYLEYKERRYNRMLRENLFSINPKPYIKITEQINIDYEK